MDSAKFGIQFSFLLATISLVSIVHAQNNPPQSDSPAKMPSAPEKNAHGDPGIVATPPATATESKTIKVPSHKVDPAITRPTDDIDQKNQQKSRDKAEAK